MRIKPNRKPCRREKNKLQKLKQLIATGERRRHIKRAAGALLRYPAFRHQVAIFQGLVGMAEAIKASLSPLPKHSKAILHDAVEGLIKEGEKTAEQVKTFRSRSIFGDMSAVFFRGLKDETK